MCSYIRLRNTRKLSSFENLPENLRLFAAEQGAIGWREFTERGVYNALFIAQEQHLCEDEGKMIMKGWTKGFITKLLNGTHGQWINKNSSLYQREEGYTEEQFRAKSLKELVALVDTATDDVPADSRFLLEIGGDKILHYYQEKQSYWIMAVKAARKAGRRVVGRKARQGKGDWATENRRKWMEKVNEQHHLGTRESRKEAEGWGLEEIPRKSRRKGRAGEAALVSNKSRPFRRKWKIESQPG